jgi:hypothetical protein
MSKITVRADDELVSRLEAMDASKSQVVREALRAYLTDVGALGEGGGERGGAFIEDADGGSIGASTGSLDEIVAERVDDRLAEQLPALVDECVRDALVDAGALGRDVNVNITLDGGELDAETRDASSTAASPDTAANPPGAANPETERAPDGAEEPDATADDAGSGSASAATSASTESQNSASAATDVEADDGTAEPERAATADGGGDAADGVESVSVDAAADGEQSGPGEDASTCAQCGSAVSAEHVHCPNCGAKTSRRVFCECGDEVRSDWSFCPSCGRRTTAARVLDSS